MIREDRSYLSNNDMIAIEKGLAELDVYSIRIGREKLTEKEKTENLRVANSVSKEERDKYCDDKKEKTALKIKSLIELLSNKFAIYQYKDDISYKSNWDLFFWCNSNEKGKDFSYVTLNTNKNRTLKERLCDIKKVIKYIKEIEIEGLDVVIQYCAKYNEEKVKDMAEKYFKRAKDTFISYRGMDGRIKEVGTGYQGNKCYGFFKKRARRKYYKLSNKDMAIMEIQSC